MEFKKVEIIERITDSNGNVTENMLTVWKNLNLNNNSANLRISELEVCYEKIFVFRSILFEIFGQVLMYQFQLESCKVV